MLVLTRNIEGVIYAGNLKIRVLEIRSRKVKLGISAPADTKILRGELVDRKSLPGPIPGRHVEVNE